VQKPLKILFCIDCLVRGGTELQLVGLIERLDPEKYEPHLLTIRPTDLHLAPANCRVLAWHVPSLFSLAGARDLYDLVHLLRRERFDVVQTFFQDSTVFAGIAARLAGVPIRVACFRDMGFWSTRSQAILMRISYSMMTGYISNAAVVREHFARHFGVDEQRVRIIRNGVDVLALPFVQHTGAVGDIGIVGNMTRAVKRTDLFIRAAAQVAQQYPAIRWHIVGDGQMRVELEALASELGVVERIVFAGRVADVAGYLERLQIGVVCSDSEGLSNALIEYMFKGVVCVATSVGGNPELVIDGKTGLLVPPADVAALASALIRLIEDRELRDGLVQAARQHVEEYYSWERCLTAHDDFYFNESPRC
jgi:glycosyltransferase involved in cell wall biosynthesis